MRVARGVLVVAGAGLLGWGVFSLVSVLHPEQLLGLAVWLAGAVVLHDAVIAPSSSLLGIGLGRFGSRLTPVARAFVVAGFVVGAVLTIVVLPEIHAKSLGTLNPSVLPSDYARRLAAAWGVIVVVVGVVVGLSLRRRTLAESE